MKKPNTADKLVQKAKWVLYGGIALNTVLLASLADWPKLPKVLGE